MTSCIEESQLTTDIMRRINEEAIDILRHLWITHILSDDAMAPCETCEIFKNTINDLENAHVVSI
jgi:hypothetical protein